MGSTTPSQALCFERKNKRVASGNRKPQLEGPPCCPCPLPTYHDGGRLLTPVKAHVPQCIGLELDTYKCLMYALWKLIDTSEPVPYKDIFGVSAFPGPLHSGWCRGVMEPADSRDPDPAGPRKGSWITPIRFVPPPARKRVLTQTFRNMFPLPVSLFIPPKLLADIFIT